MQAPSWLTAQLIVSVVTNIIVVHVILVTCAYLIYLERKISAYIQDRIGPNRVGFDFGIPQLGKLKGALGLGQSLADGLKFILKEDYTPNRVDKVMFTLAPGIIIVPALIGFIIIPWGGSWMVGDFTIPLINMTIPGGLVQVSGANINIGIVYLLAVASLGVYGVALGGWASNNKYSFLGGLRATAQMISYEIPLGLALLATLLLVGSVYPETILRHQATHGWLIFSQPLGALLFFIAILAEANRAPFDNAEAEQELVGGYHTEYSAMRFALFFLAEYSHMVTSSAFFAMLFLGGYQLSPWGGLWDGGWTSPDAVVGFGPALVKFLVFFGKVILLIAFMMLIRWTIPRLRYDQIMTMAWQLVIPTALALVVAISVLVYLGYTSTVAMLLANVGIIVLVLAAAPLFSRGPANRKIPLYGSRFSPMPGERVSTAPTEPAALQEHAG
ncbi:MAG TPA: complex I subunit 1 family protein [Phycisphaerales bacterium]|nr:complex I subunit 1 family protein [Phycisphaerales bacterium]